MTQDIATQIILFEQGELIGNDVLDLFQTLVDTGIAWSLQGSYGRYASQLLEEGLINNK